MTGDRIAFAVGNKQLISGLAAVKSQIDSGPPVYIQKVAAKALESYKNAEQPDFLKKNNRIYAERRDVLVDRLCAMGFTCEKPKATFYVWLNCKSSSIEFATKLLSAGVAVTPGIGFGKNGKNYVGLSFTQPKERNVEAGKCVSCGTCVVACPFTCLDLVKEKPIIVKECKVCGICAQVCPRYQWTMAKVENFVFGRERNPEEEFGIHRRLVIAQTTDEGVTKVRQDGGVATALLLYALKNGLIDSAIVAGTDKEKPFFPKPMLATTADEILEAAGTKYYCSPNILALADMLKQKKASVAFVGTPCQIHAVRRMP